VEQQTHNKEQSCKQTAEEQQIKDRVILLVISNIFKGPSADISGNRRRRPIPIPVVLFWAASSEGDWGCYGNFLVDCWITWQHIVPWSIESGF